MIRRPYSLVPVQILCAVGMLVCQSALAETLRQATPLDQLLKEAAVSVLVEETVLRGDPFRGAILFHKSAAACVRCHATGSGTFSFGPNLANLKSETLSNPITQEYLIQALLYPSKDIRKGFETVSMRTTDGTVVTGIIQAEDDTQVLLQSTSDLSRPIPILKSEIEARTTSKQSQMPEGLISAFRDQGEFFDIAAYVFEVVEGGQARADQLNPTPEQLVVKEDWVNLDHAGILKSLKTTEFEAGKAIFQGYCIDCHGADGSHATLSTSRAFGTQSMKFGADPYRLFMTLTKGNGLMGPMSHLSPYERYEVVHYIREQFMKPTNPDYIAIDRKYLDGLPKGTQDGKSTPVVDRDFGVALASQLERRFRSVLTVRLGTKSLATDLHTMNQAELWQEGFLDLSETQHMRNRGEGTPKPIGKAIDGLQGWEWGHAGTLDYSREAVLPRGPLPDQWMKYRGYHLHGSQVLMNFQIDGRDVLESAVPDSPANTIRRRLEIGPGRLLILAVAKSNFTEPMNVRITPVADEPLAVKDASATGSMISIERSHGEELAEFIAASVQGDTEGLRWEVDSQKRLVLTIPESTKTRSIEISVCSDNGETQRNRFRERIRSLSILPSTSLLSEQTHGGALLWPEILSTVGYRGLQQGAYALDTLTIPVSTPWNTWFRTTALDFLSDGRMVLATHGGDVWIVSGIDDKLLHLKWKRFAAGLYEPMGVKVVDNQIFLTCKDRIVRLHDRDNNGEADFYENFSDETDVSFNFHAFNFDLQTDEQGNFYYAKGGNGSDMALPGAVIRVSRDGSKREAFSTGFRAPNGMGTLPGGLITCSDNQGHWMPASKISLLKPGGFYGWVQNYDGKGKWAPDGGRIDVTKVVPPKSFDPPLIWMPQEFDNSSGGQIWVDEDRWGPLSGRLLHTSFGKGWLSYLMIQKVDEVHQAAIVKLPFDFRTGIMRGRVNPKDGQVYVAGLQGWNGGGRIGLLDQGVQRLRYTGKPMLMVTDCKVEHDGLRVHFNFPVDPNSLQAADAFEAKHWNYLWQASYGSEMYSPSTNRVRPDTMTLEGVELSLDHRSVKLRYRELQPVHQLQLRMHLNSADGTRFDEEVYWTIHALP